MESGYSIKPQMMPFAISRHSKYFIFVLSHLEETD